MTGFASPEPNEFEEAIVRKELKLLDPLLDILWVPTAVFIPEKGKFEGRYGLTCRWPDNDKRWQMYRDGEIGDPFDLMGWFCENIEDGSTMPLDPTAVLSLLIQRLGECDNTRQPWRDRMKETMEGNKAREKEIMDLAKEEGVDTMMYHQKQLAGESLVAVKESINS